MRMAGRLAVSFSLERNRTTGIIILKGGFCGPRNVDGLRPRRIHTRGMSVEVATPGPFNDEENKNARLRVVCY